MKISLKKSLFIAILFMGVLSLVFKQYFIFLIFISCFAFTWFFWFIIDRMKINDKYKTYVCVFIWLHIFGTLFLYDGFKYYDKFLHFLVPFFMTVMVYNYSKKYKLEFPKITILLVVLGMLVLFEFFEYFVDVFLNLEMQGRGQSGLDDTILDLLMGGLGSLTFLFFKYKCEGNKRTIKNDTNKKENS